MKKIRTIVINALAAAVITIAALFVLTCGDPAPAPSAQKFTLAFDTDGGTAIPSVTAAAGEAIEFPEDPVKDGYNFVGWFDSPERTGEPVELPSVMPEGGGTYYAKFEPKPPTATYTVRYEYNLGGTPSASILPSTVEVGQPVTVKDGKGFGTRAHRFVGWTDSRGGVVAVTGEKNGGQYMPGETFVPTSNMTLYAQWAREYEDARGSDDKIYVYAPLIGKGLGAAILVREGKDDKYGFVASAEATGSGYDEFTFNFDEAEGGDLVGRLYDDYTFATEDGTRGEYLQYSFITEDFEPFILATDGYGAVTITEIVGDITAVRYFGHYEYNEEYGDYTLYHCDPETGVPLTDGDEPIVSYFVIARMTIEKTEFDGAFAVMGGESGSHLLYFNGELDNYRLDLDGYGGAELLYLDPTTEKTEVVSSGYYRATEEYFDYSGEWEYVPVSGKGFKFVLNTLSSGTDLISVYIEFDADNSGAFASGASSLYLDGYGGARYTANGLTFEGNCTVGETLVTFVPYTQNDDGSYTAGAKLYFNIDRANKTFTVNSEGFVIDAGVLKDYKGESDIVVIPDNVTEVQTGAFGGAESEVQLVSVTIPASVTVIGARAFQNNYTLRRAIFLSETPVSIDFSAENDPFRWPAGDFVIVVPESAKDAYVAAWQDCKHKIMGDVEVTIVPEFEIKDGVLLRYNGKSDDGESVAVKIPDEVTEIADGVFRGITRITSVDLNNVQKVGADAFYGCTSLKTAVMTNVRTIGENAFGGCSLLGSDSEGIINLPAAVSVGASAFNGCMSVGRFVFGAGLAEIGDTAFMEIQVYEKDPPLFIELTGQSLPELGAKIGAGNIAMRIQLPSIDLAIECFEAAGWNAYCKHLFVPSGAERGRYLYGTETLDIDGRAVFFASDLMLYRIEGEVITFYEYDRETATYETYAGTIADGKITVTLDGKTYAFKPYAGEASYTSADGKYTLVCDPLDLLPEKYADSGYSGDAEGTLNGKAVRIHVGGYSTKTINGFVGEDGNKYDIAISLDGDTLVYTETAAEVYIRNITAADGSVINLHITPSAIYVFGSLKYEVAQNADGEPVYLPAWSDWSTTAQKTGEGEYTFTRQYLNNPKLTITIKLSDDNTTFTYTVE